MIKTCCGECGECWYIGNPRTCICPDETPKKPWIGLTDEERSKIWGELPSTLNEERDACIFAEAIELYLKERNI